MNEFNVSLSPIVSGGTFLTWYRNVYCAHLFRDIAMRGEHLFECLTNVLGSVRYLLDRLLVSIAIHIFEPRLVDASRKCGLSSSLLLFHKLHLLQLVTSLESLLVKVRVRRYLERCFFFLPVR